MCWSKTAVTNAQLVPGVPGICRARSYTMIAASAKSHATAITSAIAQLRKVPNGPGTV
jgi:hypothetical protein